LPRCRVVGYCTYFLVKSYTGQCAGVIATEQLLPLSECGD
jgi:hypothetical protein